MTAEEFRNWDDPDKSSPYTLVRRAADGSLETVWYHDAYKESIGKILGIPSSSVGITATTGEGLTGFGRGEGIQVFCILTFTKEI